LRDKLRVAEYTKHDVSILIAHTQLKKKKLTAQHFSEGIGGCAKAAKRGVRSVKTEYRRHQFHCP
jgi:hypothetical protein